MNCTIDDIQRYIDNAPNDISTKMLKILLSSINDWPTPVLTLNEFLFSVEETLHGEASKRNLEQFLKTSDIRVDAWKQESIAEALEVFQYFDDGVTLRDIIANIEKVISK